MTRVKTVLLSVIFSIVYAYSQIPTTCLEIESILVDACGNPEGANEMVRFQVGNTPLVLSTMTVTWPNNSWLNLCQNATTASIVATWNSTVTQCGLLLEPTGGIIPAGKRVILVTSTNVIPAANSFAGLTDTVYVIFQCAGNTSGHFANFGSGLRTLSITVGACTETVTYDRALLEDQFGNNVAADGATVVFNWAGTPDYINIGCSAPVTPLVVNAGANQTGFCNGDTVSLTAITSGSFSAYSWSGGSGTFTSPSTHTTQYIIGAGDTNPVQLYFTATNCNGGITDTVQISLNAPPPVTITPAGPVSICNGNNVTLTASGPGPFTWSNSQSGSSITVNTAGTYIVTQTTGCGTSADTVVVVNNGTPPTAVITPMGPTALCAGGSVNLVASGGTSYQWSTNSTNASITATLAGNYSVVVTNSCGSDTAFITLTAAPSPVVNINPTSPIVLCQGDFEQVTAFGTGTITWYNGSTQPFQFISSPGTYYVVATNSCGSDTLFFTAVNGNVTAAFTASPTGGPAPLPVTFTNGSTGATQYSWDFGNGNTSSQTNPSHTFTQPGLYICILTASDTNGCSDTASLLITVDSCNYDIKIPNIITKDANGINDQFYVSYTCIEEFNAVIFDRWGVRIFEYTDPAQKWDGTTISGSTVNSGVYHYIIKVKDNNGDIHEYPGFIHIFD